MIFGFAAFVFGYALFYWGYHHFTPTRYGLWQLLGVPSMPTGQPIGIRT
jgi:hypothetical protein